MSGNQLNHELPIRVLLVEDEDLIREIMTETLVEAGLAVTEACSGAEALEILGAGPAFDLLLTDVHMPGGVSGVDVAQRVRALSPDMPVVFVTGRPDALASFGPLSPRDRRMLKPFAPSELLAAVWSSLDLSPRVVR